MGYIRTPEMREAIRQRRLGTKQSEETKAKIKANWHREALSKYESYYATWIEMYSEGISAKEIAKQYGCSTNTIHNVIKRYGISKHNADYSEFYAEWACLYIDNVPATQIAESYGVASPHVYYALNKMGIETRELSEAMTTSELNHCYFDNIDNDEKAYWLGFLAADGCVTINQKYKISLGLKSTDYEILQRFRKAVESSRTITYLTRGKYEQVRFACNSKHMVESLGQYGIIPRKSLRLELSDNIPASYYSGFVRGYFDGDGSIYFENPRKPSFTLVGTKPFLKRVQEIMMQEIGLNKTKIRTKSSVFELRYSGINTVRAIGEWIYQDARFYMKRKRERFNTIL